MRAADLGTADVVVIGAGIVGAAVAYFAQTSGLSTIVVERGSIAAGTTSRGEGNLLVSDKEAGPELELALYAQRVWREDLAAHADAWEFEAKGGLVVARTGRGYADLEALVERQRALGIRADLVPDRAGLAALEPYLANGMIGGAFYPDDAQVQPLLATHELLRLARDAGARVLSNATVSALARSGDRITGVATSVGRIAAASVVVCAGPWSGDLALLAEAPLPVLPRRGFVLVTEPLPPTVRHKVYAAEYVGDVASSDAALQVSPVVEGTPSGTVLIGSSRERVGFDASFSEEAVARIARGAIELFPVLADARMIRSYSGFRPYCPDHLPIVGEDARRPGLWYSGGHEGAGIGLSVGSAKLLVQALRGEIPDLDLSPFRPHRFAEADAAAGGATEVA